MCVCVSETSLLVVPVKTSQTGLGRNSGWAISRSTHKTYPDSGPGPFRGLQTSRFWKKNHRSDPSLHPNFTGVCINFSSWHPFLAVSKGKPTGTSTARTISQTSACTVCWKMKARFLTQKLCTLPSSPPWRRRPKSRTQLQHNSWNRKRGSQTTNCDLSQSNP